MQEKNKQNLTPESLRETVQAFQKSRIILTAYELGIFTVIAESPLKSEQIAANLNTDKRATERLLNALTSFDLIEKKNNLYSNKDFSTQYLVKGSPDYMLGLGHTANLWHSWTTLTQAVYAGSSVIKKDIIDRDSEWLRSFIGAMHYRGNIYSDDSIKQLDLTSVNRVLDLGGGSAAYAMAFIRSKPTIKVTVFDLPEVIPITNEYICKTCLNKQIDTIAGDYTSDSIGKGYDMIFLSAIVHSNSYEANKKLIKKCAEALNDNGQIVIQDFIMNDERTEPLVGTVFAINMLVGTKSGDTFTEKEVKEWFEYAGLKFVNKLPAPTGNNLMIARKL